MMKNFSRYMLGLMLILLSVSNSNAQLEFPEDKVKWKFTVEQNGDEATVIGTITMVEHWHIYAANLPEGNMAIPTMIKLKSSDKFKTVGKIIEPKPIFVHDELADEDLYYHGHTVKLKQKIKVLSTEDFTIQGVFSFQTCDDSHCLPPYDAEFSVKVKGVQSSTSSNNTIELENSDTVATENDNGESSDEVKGNDSDENTSEKDDLASQDGADTSDDPQDEANMSVWMIFLLSFGSGLLALLTPCVFPMIPMTVSFFTKQSKTKAEGIKNATIYGVSIVGIYVLLGLLVMLTGSAGLLNEMSTNPWFNIVFFVLLIIFAVSFMGAFEIRMPNSWINKADKNADKGGLIGIFFMALVLALVSFSCTGPIVGTLLVEAARTGGLTPIVGMFGFSLALALPFGLFAAFPGWMNSLPSSGGWLNSVKVVLGFLELALAFKFLSNADLAWQLHWLEREVFIAIWIGVFAALTLYLFGKLQLPHDSPVERLSVGRTLLGIFSLVFVIYMIPGMWGAPLKLINAFPPPMHYSESPMGVGKSGGGNVQEHGPEGTHLGPQNLWVFHDLDKAKEYAKSVNKPLFVDFTGHNCVNCRKMEQSVWGEPGVIDKLRDDIVVVSLYVDENVELPKEEQGEVEIEGRKMSIRTVGDKWRIAQIRMYNITAQPYYRMLGPNGEDLTNGPASFETHRNKDDFEAWLEEGLKLYNEAK